MIYFLRYILLLEKFLYILLDIRVFSGACDGIFSPTQDLYGLPLGSVTHVTDVSSLISEISGNFPPFSPDSAKGTI